MEQAGSSNDMKDPLTVVKPFSSENEGIPQVAKHVLNLAQIQVSIKLWSKYFVKTAKFIFQSGNGDVSEASISNKKEATSSKRRFELEVTNIEVPTKKKKATDTKKKPAGKWFLI